MLDRLMIVDAVPWLICQCNSIYSDSLEERWEERAFFVVFVKNNPLGGLVLSDNASLIPWRFDLDFIDTNRQSKAIFILLSRWMARTSYTSTFNKILLVRLLLLCFVTPSRNGIAKTPGNRVVGVLFHGQESLGSIASRLWLRWKL